MTFKPDDIRTYEYLIERKSTTVGFEPTRANPLDFKSNALTTRPSCHIQGVFIAKFSDDCNLIFRKYYIYKHDNKSTKENNTESLFGQCYYVYVQYYVIAHTFDHIESFFQSLANPITKCD